MAAASGKDSSTIRSRRRRLGRGLDSLIAKPVAVDVEPSGGAGQHDGRPGDTDGVPVARAPGDSPPPTHPGRDEDNGLRMVPLDAIRPNSHQPRRSFDEESLQSLAASIRSAGVMQPVVLRPTENNGYELVAGERRWRAARIVGLDRIPAIVRDIDEQTAAELALVENLQREDLNPIERAEAFRHLANDFALTHQQIADRVGLKRASVSNHLRLLELDPDTRQALEQGHLTLGHARALLAITNDSARRSLAGRTIARGWSVRELERRIRQGSDANKRGNAAADPKLPAHLQDLQNRLGEHLGTKVRIHPGRKNGAGRLTIDFYSLDEFEGLLERLHFSPDT